MPTPNDIIFNNIRRIEEKEFVHSTFWYECHNGSQFIADKMAEDLNIHYNSHINRILRSSNKWEIDGTLYDKVIFCGNLRELPFILTDFDLKRFSSEIAKLKSHGTTSVFAKLTTIHSVGYTYLTQNLMPIGLSVRAISRKQTMQSGN